jgi:hypothetical protein
MDSIEHAYLQILTLESEAPLGAMSSGGEVSKAITNPKDAIYGLWHPYTKTKKFFKTDIARRAYLENNEGWEVLEN